MNQRPGWPCGGLYLSLVKQWEEDCVEAQGLALNDRND